MAENSGIEWTDDTFNCWRGCQKVSPACKFCYAETRSNRFGEDFSGQRIVLSDAGWKSPVKWNEKGGVCTKCGGDTLSNQPSLTAGISQCCDATIRRRRVFCASLADVFEDWDGPMVNHNGKEMWIDPKDNEWITTANLSERFAEENMGWRRLTISDVRRRLFSLIDATPNLDWLLLTKRPENIRGMWPSTPGISGNHPASSFEEAESVPYRPNVWLGTTTENQRSYDERIEYLHNVQDLCKFRFLSCEPLLGPLQLALPQYPVDWVIAGGESGSNARPSHPDWFRSLRDQCKDAGVPFHFKQWGRFHLSKMINGGLMDHKFNDGTCMTPIGKKKAGRLLDGTEHNGFPVNDFEG